MVQGIEGHFSWEKRKRSGQVHKLTWAPHEPNTNILHEIMKNWKHNPVLIIPPHAMHELFWGQEWMCQEIQNRLENWKYQMKDSKLSINALFMPWWSHCTNTIQTALSLKSATLSLGMHQDHTIEYGNLAPSLERTIKVFHQVSQTETRCLSSQSKELVPFSMSCLLDWI